MKTITHSNTHIQHDFIRVWAYTGMSVYHMFI